MNFTLSWSTNFCDAWKPPQAIGSDKPWSWIICSVKSTERTEQGGVFFTTGAWILLQRLDMQVLLRTRTQKPQNSRAELFRQFWYVVSSPVYRQSYTGEAQTHLCNFAPKWFGLSCEAVSFQMYHITWADLVFAEQVKLLTPNLSWSLLGLTFFTWLRSRPQKLREV